MPERKKRANFAVDRRSQLVAAIRQQLEEKYAGDLHLGDVISSCIDVVCCHRGRRICAIRTSRNEWDGCEPRQQPDNDKRAADDLHPADEWAHHLRRRNPDLGKAARAEIGGVKKFLDAFR
jgi:hypothetical protein